MTEAETASVLLRLARREWRRCGDRGAHPDHQAGVVAGTIKAYALVTGLTDREATEHVRRAASLAMPGAAGVAERRTVMGS